MPEIKTELLIVRASAELLDRVKQVANECYEGNVSQAVRFLLYAGLEEIQQSTKDK